MVEFKLKSKENGIYIYEYYPEGDFSKKPGIVKLDTNKEEIEIAVMAEEDFVRIITAEELNESRESMNKLRQEEGDPPFTEEEWPLAKEDIEHYYYGSHVINRICDDFAAGDLKEDGMVAWY